MKKLATYLALVLILALTLSIAACSTTPAADTSPTPNVTPSSNPSGDPSENPTDDPNAIKVGGTLNGSYATEPTTWDPYLTEGADVRSLLFNIYEGLVKPTSTGDLVPAVAESYTISDDATIYTFKIRTGLKFSNGTPVTADDVIYSITRAQDLKIQSTLTKVASVTKTDASTVVITLTEPDTDFLPYLTLAILPQNVDLANSPVGVGPFILESYSIEEQIVLARNPNYWKTVYLDKIVLRHLSGSESGLLALQAGTVDFGGVDQINLSQIDLSKYGTTPRRSASVQQLNLNNLRAPFTDVRVRQALSYAINVQEIIDLVNDGYGEKAGSPVIPGLSKYYNTVLNNSYPTDLNKAKSLLAEAGLADGFTFDITVPSNYTVHVNTAQVIAQQLAKIGVTANIVQVDWGTWLGNVYTGRDYTATIVSVDGSVLSPRSFLSRYVSTASNNFVNYNNPEYDRLYAEAQTELDEAKRIDLYNQLQQLL
ncbi:MAG: ABC transporter substrate-binding protein, partial [Oscillospiraceae bacterium]|nr:ABC transporter substrate-binding protein [Oscillospiraceae bacterium]